jgi:hypothetical protein
MVSPIPFTPASFTEYPMEISGWNQAAATASSNAEGGPLASSRLATSLQDSV